MISSLAEPTLLAKDKSVVGYTSFFGCEVARNDIIKLPGVPRQIQRKKEWKEWAMRSCDFPKSRMSTPGTGFFAISVERLQFRPWHIRKTRMWESHYQARCLSRKQGQWSWNHGRKLHITGLRFRRLLFRGVQAVE